MADTLDDSIKENASGPRKAGADSVSVEQHPLADQIAVDKHLSSKAATRKPGLGVKLVKLSPGVTVCCGRSAPFARAVRPARLDGMPFG